MLARPMVENIVSGGGSVALFTVLDGTENQLTDADITIDGVVTAGGLGSGIAISEAQDFDGNQLVDIMMGAPAADMGAWSIAGMVAHWQNSPSFPDEDGDGFVSWDAGGIDCDDSNAAIYPAATEDLSNGIDDDCDGWIDDLVQARDDSELWWYDIESSGLTETDVFDFEGGTLGASSSGLYTAVGLTMFASDDVIISNGSYGSAPHGNYNAQVISDGNSNQLRLYFTETIEAIGLYFIDPEGEFTLTATNDDGPVISNYTWTMLADDQPGGRFLDCTFLME